MVLTILKSTQWMEAMRSCRTIAGETFTGKSTLNTPMRLLVKKFPDLAEFVLDKCYKEVKRDSEVCIEMNFEFVEDTFNYKKIEGPKHSMVMKCQLVNNVKHEENALSGTPSKGGQKSLSYISNDSHLLVAIEQN